MVGLSFDDSAGTIDLLGKSEADHLVGERHLGERQLFVGSGINVLRESVWTTYNEDESARCVALLF